MTKDTAKDFLPLVQALADGITIQFKSLWPASETWHDVETPDFTDPIQNYRIKPREWECIISEAGYLIDSAGTIVGPRKTIRVREII